jgi:hypothetical protein
LSWEAADGAGAYDLYLWPASEPRPDQPTAAGLTRPLFHPSGELKRETTYRWQLVARGAAGAAVGPVWTFTTEAGADLEVSAGAEKPVWTIGGRASVRWKLALDAGTTCHFELRRDGAKVADLGAAFSPNGEGDFAFQVPEVAPGRDYRLRVRGEWLEKIQSPRAHVEIPVELIAQP